MNSTGVPTLTCTSGGWIPKPQPLISCVESFTNQKATNMNPTNSTHASNSPLTRRRFLAGTSASVLAFTVIKPELVRGTEANSKIDFGLIGCGGRGKWIADLLLKHGGYNLVATADYFQDRADSAAEMA